MYIIGSTFYALYFVVGFPMFVRINRKMTLFQTILESFASCMIVFCLCDFWRLFMGGRMGKGVDIATKNASSSLPFSSNVA